MDKRTALLVSLAEILEVPSVTPETALDQGGSWDSVAVVQAVGEIDVICGVVVDGVALGECQTVLEVLLLAGLGEKQRIDSTDVGNLNDVLR